MQAFGNFLRGLEVDADVERSPRRWSLTAVLVVLVLVTGAALTWFAWRYTQAYELRALERQLTARATNIEIVLRDRLLAYEAVLHAGVGLLKASEEVDANEWQDFSEQLQVASFYPGLQGLGYAKRLQDGDSMALVGVDRDRTKIVFLEPHNERNLRALGFDMMSEGTRREAMERARDEGVAALTGTVTLVQEITADKQPGFLMYVPVYENGNTPPTIAERRRLLDGFVYCPFRARDFLSVVVGPLTDGVVLELYGAPPGRTPSLLFRSMGAEAPGTESPSHSRSFELFGQRWLMHLSALPSFVEGRKTSEPLWILLTGAICTLLLASLVWALALSRQRLADKLSAENKATQREQHASQVLENSLDAYISIDSSDRIVEWNRQAERIFGWDRQEVLGLRLVDTIIPPQYRDQHLHAVSTFETRAHTLLDRRVAMPAVRRDGQEITVELSIFPTALAEQPLFVASLRDITELLRHQAEIVALNATLEQNVAKRTEELAAANRELHASNQQLEAFAQNVSHDLRAPLRAIDGYTQIAIEESGGALPASVRTHLSAAGRQVRKMQSLIDDLLKLAFIGRQPVQKRAINLWTLILGVIGDLHVPKPPVLDVKPDELGNVLADPALLEHALRNLLANAFKFTQTRSEPRVQIGSEVQNGERVYFVKDNGVGFDKKYAVQLFKVFHRLHGPEQFEGTGIGLSIVKSVIEKHGGRVWADAEPGAGATFYFTLPGN